MRFGVESKVGDEVGMSKIKIRELNEQLRFVKYIIYGIFLRSNDRA